VLEVLMELALVLVLAVPLGRLLSSRKHAWLVLAAVFLVVLPFQTASVHDEGHLDALYWPVQAVIPGLGVGLVALGSWRRGWRGARIDPSVAG
jgi:peptidoglycan/LPS O-acetylase OafA/YrhL